MIQLAEASEEPNIRECVELAYARNEPAKGHKPAPMIADFAAQVAAGVVSVATNERDAFQGSVVFYHFGEHHASCV